MSLAATIPEGIPGAVIWNQPLKTHLKVLGLNASQRTETCCSDRGGEEEWLYLSLNTCRVVTEGGGRSFFVRTQALNLQSQQRGLKVEWLALKK